MLFVLRRGDTHTAVLVREQYFPVAHTPTLASVFLPFMHPANELVTPIAPHRGCTFTLTFSGLYMLFRRRGGISFV